MADYERAFAFVYFREPHSIGRGCANGQFVCRLIVRRSRKRHEELRLIEAVNRSCRSDPADSMQRRKRIQERLQIRLINCVAAASAPTPLIVLTANQRSRHFIGA